MSSDDGLENWPPPPSNGYQAQIDNLLQTSATWSFGLSCTGRKLTITADYKSHSFHWTLDWLDWLRPLVWGVVGAVIGTAVLLSDTLLSIFYGKEADRVIDFKFGLFLAVVFGTIGGFICGVGCWFIGRVLAHWRGHNDSIRR